MSDLDNAIQSMNTAAERTTKTTEFVDQLSTYDDISDVTNPNTGVTVPSLQKKTRLVAEAAFAESETQINQAVSDAELSALAAQSAANYDTEFVAGVTSAIKGKSYLYNDSMWACLNDTTETPEIDNVNWYSLATHNSLTNRDDEGAHPASAISMGNGNSVEVEVKEVEDRLLGVGAKIYRGSNGRYVQNGDTVPAGTTHLRVLVGGEPTILVAWDNLTLPAIVTSVPTSDNSFAGYDVVTNQGTFEFVTASINELRGNNSHPTLTRESNVLGWGLVGDGVTDNSSKMEKVGRRGGRVYVPCGDYLLNDPVNIESSLYLFGDGKGSVSFTSNSASNALTVSPGVELKIYGISITSSATTLNATGCTSLSIKNSLILGDVALTANYDENNQLTNFEISDDCKIIGKVRVRIDSLGSDVHGRWKIDGSDFNLGVLDNESGIIFTCRENGTNPIGDFYGFEMSNCQVTCDGVIGSGEDIINMGGRFKTPKFELLLIKNTVSSDVVEMDLFDGGDDFVVKHCTFIDVALKCFGSTSNPERAYSLIHDNTFRLSADNPNPYCIIRRFSFVTISENTFVCDNALNAPIFMQADDDASICEYVHIKDNTAVLSNEVPFILANGLRYSRITGNISPNSPIIVNQGTRVVEKNIISGNIFAETSSAANASIPPRNVFDGNIAENATVTGLRQTKKLSEILVVDTGSSTVSVEDAGYYIRPLSDLDTVTGGVNGDLLTLQFGGVAGIVITHTSGFAGGGKFKLEGGVNFTSSGNDWVTFRYIRGFWVEQSRGVIG